MGAVGGSGGPPERLEAERQDAVMVATLAGFDPKLIEEERQRLEAFVEAKREADASGKRMKEEDIGDAGPSAAPTLVRVKEEDVGSSAGPSRTATVINIDTDSSSLDWDEDYVSFRSNLVQISEIQPTFVCNMYKLIKMK
jgi:hypothetical protein